ncbi:hypothetical protein [Diaphorobacter sp.]|uniref:hypothetical protein n=1 Tax=Diaphorobacter sp. TaxID=1934310 RepID=UPI002587139A|nr:hypothetical protein [Diaphorobacter sp.]
MRRGIRSITGLVASLTARANDKAIEAAGGFEAPAKPNRELRRRMERDARREARLDAKKGNTP